MAHNKMLFYIGALILLALDLGNGNEIDLGGINSERDPKICNQIYY